MKEVKFACSDEVAHAVASILSKLVTVSDKSFRRVVRIGGTEITFDARGNDGIIDVNIDEEGVEDWLAANAAPTPTPVPVSSPSTLPLSDSDEDEEDDEDDVQQSTTLPPVHGVGGTTQTQSTSAITDDEDEDDAVKVATETAMAGNQMFTAFDITRDCRERGLTTQRHNVLKHVIHDMWSNGEMPNYERTLVPIRGIGDQAFLYHPQGTDADDYVQVSDAVAS